jgi:hypothetical protein
LTWYLHALSAASKLAMEWYISNLLGSIDNAIKNTAKPTKSEKTKMADLEKEMPEKCMEQYRSVNASVQNAEEYGHT